MSDSTTLAQSKEAEARWKADYERLVARFGDQTPERATAPTTDSGLPIKSCYFPHAVERILALRAERDAQRWADAMRRFEQAAVDFAKKDIADLGADELMLAAIEAARANATTGEMMGVLKQALGWGPPHER